MYRRRLIAVASALVVLVVVAAGVASAADNDKQSNGQPFALVGTWEVTLMLPGAPPARVLATFNADGTTVESAPLRRPPLARRTAGGSGPGMISTPSHGSSSGSTRRRARSSARRR